MTDAERDRMLTDIHARISVIADSVQRHDHTLYGNGRPGLAAELQRIGQEQDACPARRAASLTARQTDSSVKAAWAAVITSVLAAGAAVAALFR